ncbi:MAG: mannosyltransferase [Thermoleophilaceae bacterium]|jgi:hypothetical protein|nr:mannosyltransferase [Thermoleophilaceae bacterium]
MAGVLTLVALVLRLPGLQESLAGDEFFTYDIVTRASLGDVLDEVRDAGENSPPLFFVLSWLSAKLGDPTTTLRLPSLVLGTATVPLVYLLGARSVGRLAGLVGAAVLALSPFAVFYSVEARAYATLSFFAVASTLALLCALEGRGWRRWALYALAALGVVYSHYTGVFVLLVQAAWVAWAHRDRLKQAALAWAAVVLGFVPYLPFFFEQRDQAADVGIIEFLGPFTLENLVKSSVTLVAGYPFAPLRDVPGRLALALLALGACIGLVSALLRAGRPKPGLVLIAGLAVATPLGVSLASQVGRDILVARNLSASLPFAALLLGAAAAAARPRLVPLAAALVLAPMAIGVVAAGSDEHRRTPYDDIAQLIDQRARPGDPVLDVSFIQRSGPLTRTLLTYFEQPHDVFRGGIDDRAAWRQGERSGQVFVVSLQVGSLRGQPKLEPELQRRFRLADSRYYAANFPVAVFVYESVRPAASG